VTADEIGAAVRNHLGSFFSGHSAREHVWTLGPAPSTLPRLRVVEFAPGPQATGWVYTTIGAWEARGPERLEFVLVAPAAGARPIELLTMTAWYHQQRGLGLGHTFPIGEPWLPGSSCESMLVSLPYPFGRSLEVCPLAEGEVRFLWLLPITREEREFKAKEGEEALERRFDAAGIEYWNPLRPSVV
jgi:hypothetical protein